MPLTPTLATVAVFHGDGNITQYRPGSDGVTVDESVMGYNGARDISIEFQSFGATHLRHTVPLRDTLEVLGLPDPYSLASLEVAWENAEQAGECRKGDVLIMRPFLDEGGFKIITAESRGCINAGVTRILTRSPREPWQDLVDVLRDYDGSPDPAHVAPWLHERGVRVTDGDDDE